jgi:hypothetical protein
MASHIKIFGSFPAVSVQVRERGDGITTKNSVDINWSCVGAVKIERAAHFKNNLYRAILYARSEQGRMSRAKGKRKK